MTRRVAPLRAAPPRYGLTWRTYVVNAPAGFTAAWAIIKLFLDPVVCRKVSILGELGKARENRSRPRNRAARRAPRRTRAARSLSLRPLPSRFPFADDSDPPRSAPLTRARRARDGPPRAALSGRDAAAQAGRAR